MTVERRSQVAFALLACLSLLGGLLLVWTSVLSTHAQDWVTHTLEVGRQLDGVRASVGDVEASVRGYVATGDPAFLPGFREGERALESELAALSVLLVDNPAQSERALRLRSLVREKVAFNEQVVQQGEREGLEAARALVATERGLRLSAQIKAELAQMQQSEHALLQARQAKARSWVRSAYWVGGLLALVLLVSLAVFGAMIRSWLAARRRAERAQRSSDLQVRTLLDAIRDYAILMLDPSGTVQTWTPAAERILGYSAAEVVGTSFKVFYPPSQRDRGDPERELRVAKEQGRYEEEGLRQRKGGEIFWADVVVTAIRDPSGALQGFAKVVRDITERKQAEDQVRVAYQRLEASNRELQDFAMIASHDLQEPLRKIQMFADKLRRQYAEALGVQGRDWLERMTGAATRGRMLIDGLLAFSRLTTRAQPPTAVDLNETAREVIGDLEGRLAETRGSVDLGPLPKLEADPLQMRQLFQNLIGNALKFRRPNVPPRIQIRATPLGDGPQPQAHRLEVADNGIGFDEKYVDRIFKLFQRLQPRSEYEGSGVGLAICRKIVERQGGTITAHSHPGEGTTFVIDLPSHPPH